MKRTSDWQAGRAYNALPKLPPQADLETKLVLKQCVRSRAALAELKQAAELIPNQAMLINTLPLLEAKDSSRIENIVTTTDELFRFADLQSNAADAPTKEALRYRAAIRAGFSSIAQRPLSTVTAVEICQIVKGVQLDVRRVPGTALANEQTGAIIYTPPEGETQLRDLLANWEWFLHEESTLDPLVRMAVAHYQFEAIHPFTDGNGRTGRILNTLFLVQEGLLGLPILYLSRFILARRSEYYSKLLAVTREQAWEPWLMYMLEAVEETSCWTIAKITAIRLLNEHTAAYVKARLPKMYSAELVDLLFAQPYCRIAHFDSAGIAKRQTASKYLKALVRIGVLRELEMGREKLFVHPKLMTLLTTSGTDWSHYR